MAYSGGKRKRLVKDNFYNMLYASMDSLDWFDTNKFIRPVEMVPEQIDSTEDLFDRPMELGSDLTEDRWSVAIDVFAERESVGVHLAGDIHDILRGKMAAIGRTSASFAVYDLIADPDEILFYVDIENVEIGRARNYNETFNKYWWVIICELVDTYYDETEA